MSLFTWQYPALTHRLLFRTHSCGFLCFKDDFACQKKLHFVGKKDRLKQNNPSIKTSKIAIKNFQISHLTMLARFTQYLTSRKQRRI